MSAVQAIKSFRIQQLKSLNKHLSKFGPLPAPTDPPNPAIPHRLPNPFLPRLNPSTRRWAPPAISLRRQADLIKRAKESDTMYLLPPGPKVSLPTTLSIEEAAIEARKRFGGKPGSGRQHKDKDLEETWMNPIEWDGKTGFKEVAGAELGLRLYATKKRMFKGHKWERVREEREKKRKMLLRDMDKRIRRYKTYYQRRKPDPLKTSSSAKSRKLPF